MIRPIIFGKFCLLERLSVGGMAEIYRAKLLNAPHFKRYMVVKRILPSLADDHEFIQMFIDEARISVELNHPNVCQIYELGRLHKAHYMVMEFIPGHDLLQIQKHFRRQKKVMAVSQACYIVAQIASGLDYAHRAMNQFGEPLGIIHRDISPQNVLISYGGDVKLIDFGVAKAASKNSKTQAGVLKGKFGYMSPEQADGISEIDQRSDLFALGTLFWELLTNRRLFHDENDYMTLEKVRACNVPEPSSFNHLVPPTVDAIVQQALQRDPNQRYQWCSEMAQDLIGYLNDCNPPYSQGHLRHWMCSAFAEDLKEEHEKISVFNSLNTPHEIKRYNANIIVEEEWAKGKKGLKVLDHDGAVVPDLEDFEDFEGEETQVFTPEVDYRSLQSDGMVLPSLDAGFAETLAEMKAVQLDQIQKSAASDAKSSRTTTAVIVFAMLIFLAGLGVVSYLLLVRDDDNQAEAVTPAIVGSINVTVTPPNDKITMLLIDKNNRSAGNDVGPTSKFSGLSYGRYVITVEHPDYVIVNRNIELNKSSTDVVIALIERKRIKVSFEVDPPDSTVRFNDEELPTPADGSGTRTAEARLGATNSIWVKKPGFKGESVKDLIISAGETPKIPKISLKPAQGMIKFKLNRTARVFLKGATVEQDLLIGSAREVSYPVNDTSQTYYFKAVRENYKTVDMTISGFDEANDFLIEKDVNLEKEN